MNKNLRVARLRAGIKAYQAADLLGVSPSMMSKFEKGENRLNQNQLLQLAELYEYSVDYLLARHDAQEEEAGRLFLRFVKKLNPRGMLRLAEYSEELAGNPKFSRDAESAGQAEPKTSLPRAERRTA